MSELSGLPSSWATPAASRMTESLRSFSMVSSRLIWASVISDRTTTYPPVVSLLTGASMGTMYIRTMRFSG